MKIPRCENSWGFFLYLYAIIRYYFMLRSFIIVIIFFISQNSSAQTYYNFPTSNAKWSENSYTYGAGPLGSFEIHSYNGWAFTLGNDIIISQKHYSMVGYQSTWSYSYGTNGVFATNDSLNPPGIIFGAIHEDSSKKVWYRNLISFDTISNNNPLKFLTSVFPFEYLKPDSDVILYDFNLNVGDSIKWIPGVFSFYPYPNVQSIDTILMIDNTYRKRFTFLTNCGPVQDYWIEGIGSSFGLFGSYVYPLISDPTDIQGNWLSCFSQNNQYLFQHLKYPDISNCNATIKSSSSIDTISEYRDFIIYPSISNSIISIVKPDKYYTLQIINTLGQLVYSQHVSSEKFTLDISSLEDGMYYIKAFQSETKINIGKFVKCGRN
jgi:hypothetical protein